MGQTSTKLNQTVRSIREDDVDLSDVELEDIPLSEKTVRKLGDALRTNRSVVSTTQRERYQQLLQEKYYVL